MDYLKQLHPSRPAFVPPAVSEDSSGSRFSAAITRDSESLAQILDSLCVPHDVEEHYMHPSVHVRSDIIVYGLHEYEGRPLWLDLVVIHPTCLSEIALVQHDLSQSFSSQSSASSSSSTSPVASSRPPTSSDRSNVLHKKALLNLSIALQRGNVRVARDLPWRFARSSGGPGSGVGD
jgi:hypothetical protein